MGYYTYKEGEEPDSAEDIEDLKIISPNVSHFGSDGGLFEGNRVYLGTFPKGTVIGWFLVANGFHGANVTDGYGIRYPNVELNSERDPENKGHMVALWDKSREHFLLGFEDMGRNPENRNDEDFNEAVFLCSNKSC